MAIARTHILVCGGTGCSSSNSQALIDELKRFRKGNGKTSREFRRKVTQIKYEDNLKDYTYKCEVCGKTDAEYPELEFRYCSRCAGYHCFCSEHINNHVHFTE